MNEKANYGAVTLFCPTIRCCDNICPSAGKISANLAEKIFDNLVFENTKRTKSTSLQNKITTDGCHKRTNDLLRSNRLRPKEKYKMFLFPLRQVYVWAGLAKLVSRYISSFFLSFWTFDYQKYFTASKGYLDITSIAAVPLNSSIKQIMIHDWLLNWWSIIYYW